MAKKPLGPEGARFKKADWNPQATGSKGTYISDRDALEARVAELEKVNGITVEVVTVKAEHLKGSGPYIVRYLVEDAQRIEHDFYKKADRALENLMRERVQAALESNDPGSLASLGKLPPVAVIKSADGECFVPMPTAGIVRPSLPDLSRVNEGDEIFKVQLDAELYDQEERAFAALGIAALEVAKSYRDAAQYSPLDIEGLELTAEKLGNERDKLRDQIAKDKNRVANATVVENKLGGFTIAAAIGWIAAIGLYIYSDLPIPFVGGSNAERSVLSEAQIACVKRAVETDYGEPYRLLPSSSYLDDADGDILNFVPVNNSQDSIMGIRVQNIEISRGSGDWYTVELNVLNPIENNNGPLRYMGIDLRAFTFNDGGCTQIMKQNRTVSLVERNILEDVRRTRLSRQVEYDGVLLQPGEQRRFSYSFHFNEGQSGTPVVTGLNFLASRNP